MRILGIVAEYDPFHNGHLFHMEKAREACGADAAVVVLSGCFRQRGEAALLSPYDRARCALEAGADAVLALPVSWTVRDAEHYALGAVSLLSSLGTTHLAFGAECADLPLMERAAALLEEPDAGFDSVLKAALSEGLGYPAALSRALGSCLPEAAGLLDLPNNILAVCYLRALRRLKADLVPVLVPRRGAYHARGVDPDSPSAGALRSALRRGDWKAAQQALPEVSFNLLRERFLAGCVPDPARLDVLALDRLRSISPAQVTALPDCSEGLENALLKAAAEASSTEEIVRRLTGRRYPAARIRRLCACALLGITRNDPAFLSPPDKALLLGLKKNPSLTGSWKNSAVQVLSAADWMASAPPADRAAWRVWALACGLPGTVPFTEKTISL